MLENKYVLEALQAQFGDAILAAEESYGMLSFEINPAKNTEIATWLFEHPELKVTFLTDLCGVHFPNNAGKELGVVYHFHSFENNFRMRMKAFIPVANPTINTMTTVYNAANWMERETFDFYGILFEGHPNLKRILNVDDMDYFPMRKEYPLEDATRTDKDDRYFGR